MSNTRHSAPGTPPSQERYASSEEFTRGLNAYLVSRRCSVLDRAEDRELIYFLLLLSHQDGGFKKLADEILAVHPDKICTASMGTAAIRAGQIYTGDQIRVLRREIPSTTEEYLLKGENDVLDVMADSPDLKTLAGSYPTSYPAKIFVKKCLEGAKSLECGLENYLSEICLDPAQRLDRGPWYFHDLINTLKNYQARWIEDRRRRTVVTALGEKLNEALDYALESRCMVLVEGLARMGKTFGAKAWADQHPGRARYVQVPSGNDEGGFFRAIAKALGLASGLSMKAVQLRDRVEETLQFGDLLLILDEAHYLWPVSNSRFAFPSRISWVMTALVNKGVPVALISTPQFIKTQKVLEARTHWNSDQLTGRIDHYEKLPSSLSEDDLAKVARALLPEGNSKSIELLTVYAQGSLKYLAGIEAIVRRARFLAHKEKRDLVSFADLKRATNESVIPSDSALAQALAMPIKGRKKTVLMPVNEALTGDGNSLDAQPTAPLRGMNFADRKPAETLEQSRLGRPHEAPYLAAP